MALRAKERPELVLNKSTVEGIGLEVWGRRDGAARAPLAVVCLPGNPALQFGSSHAKSPLIAAVVQAMREIRVPVVSFDYPGVGMSAPGGPSTEPKKWRIPSPSETMSCTKMVVGLTKWYVSDKVVLCGYSYGASQALEVMLSDNEFAYMSLSMGYNVFKFIMDAAERESVQRGMENHSKMTCRALYVVGQKDRMTPLEEVERLTKARTDGGSGAAVEVIRDAGHDMKGFESVAADFCAGFVDELEGEVSKAAENPEAAAVGPDPAEEQLDCRVTCLEPTKGSVHDSLHVTVPTDATVGTLRQALGAALAREMEVYELDGMTFRPLRDEDTLPAWVSVQKLNCDITTEMVLTVSQCCEAQDMMKTTLQTEQMQRQLDGFEQESKGVAAKYRMLLQNLLNTEVYPAIVGHFSLPEGTKGVQILLGAIQSKSDISMIRSWLELEKLMRNKAMIQRAEATLQQWQAAQGPAVGG